MLLHYKPDYVILGGTRILKEHIISAVENGFLNSHPAILPKYKGSDCVGWSILNGDVVGATVHLIDSGIDSGPIILQETVNYSDCLTLGDVRVKVTKKCTELIIKSLIGLSLGSLKPIPQDSSLGENHFALSDEKLEIIEKIIAEQNVHSL